MAPELTPLRRRLLTHLLRKQGLIASTHPGVPKRSETGPAPLTFAQEALWVVDQLESERALHNVPAAIRLAGELDARALERSLNEIVRRHEALRTTFRSTNGQPHQVVAPHVPFAVTPIDLSGTGDAEAVAAQRVHDEVHRPFDLERGPLFRVLLLRLNTQTHVLLLNFHHLVTDGWSMGVFTRELDQLYGAFRQGQVSPLAEVPVQMSDVAEWQRRCAKGAAWESHRAHWRSVIGTELQALKLPTDYPRPRVWSFRGRHHPLHLYTDLSDAIRELARRQGATLFMTLTAVFYALLYHRSGQDDIVIGSAVADRGRQELEGVIGFLVNMLVLRADLRGNPDFPELLRRVRETTLGAYAHQDLPLTHVVREAQPDRDPGRSPLFQVEFSLLTPDVNPAVYGYGLGAGVGETVELSGLTVTPMPVEYDNARYDLAVFLWDMPDGIRGTIEYSSDLFEPATVAMMGEQFEALLRLVVKRPQVSLDTLAQHLRETEAENRMAAVSAFDRSASDRLRARLQRGRGR